MVCWRVNNFIIDCFKCFKNKIVGYRIVSYGYGDLGCGSVGINTRVDYFRNWIDEKLNDN